MEPLSKSGYQKLISDISDIYEKAKFQAIQVINRISMPAYWEIGRHIVEVEQRHNIRAEYGTHLIERASGDLIQKYGKGFSSRNLEYMRRFYLVYPIPHTYAELEWSHYKLLLSIKDKDKRSFYEKQIIKHGWDVRSFYKVLKHDKIKLQVFRTKRDSQKEIRLTSKLSFIRGRLYTYKILEPEYLHPVEENIVVDCGFEVNIEVPIKGITKPKEDEIIESIKTKDGYMFKESDANKNQLYTYKALVERLVDADTFWFNIDCGFNIWTHQNLRLRGIDAPEISTQKGKKAKGFVEDIFKRIPFVIIKTYSTEKYGRWLVDIFYLKNESDPQKVLERGTFLNQELLDLRLAKVMG